MKTFGSYLEEASNALHCFDFDDTLFTHDKGALHIHVNDEKGNRIKSLSGKEYSDHTLSPGHSYDYSDLRSAAKLHQHAHPIRPMIAKMKAIHKNGGKTAIVTARSDFHDVPEFHKFMKGYGIDIHKTHVYRAGNIPLPTPKAKKKVISGLIKQHNYKHVHLYDDSHENLKTFLKLKKNHNDVTFHAHHVDHDKNTGTTKVKTTTV
jgi:hypothetical protein